MSYPPGSPEDFAEQIRSEVDQLLDEADGSGLSPGDLAASTERQLNEQGAGGFDPPIEEHWRAVVAELRRR
jgi:hypothetical protein